MKKKETAGWIMTAAITGGLAVTLGAFGAHTLKSSLTEYQLGIFETGVDYQFYHALAIAVLAILAHHQPSQYLKYAYTSFLIGIICFSGSLYLLATREILGIEAFTKILGPITPIGGVLFTVGWICLLLHGLHLRKLNKD